MKLAYRRPHYALRHGLGPLSGRANLVGAAAGEGDDLLQEEIDALDEGVEGHPAVLPLPLQHLHHPLHR